jgi:DNA-binding MarR family transcriptional regulator
MEDDLRSEFTRAMMRVKGLRGLWSSGMGLNMSEGIILRMIGHGEMHSDRQTCTALIQDRLHISKPAISQNLTSLEEKGLITRSINRHDRRRFDFELTEAGMTAAEQMHSYADERMASVLSQMGEGDVRELIRLLNKLGGIIEDRARQSGVCGAGIADGMHGEGAAGGAGGGHAWHGHGRHGHDWRRGQHERHERRGRRGGAEGGCVC